MIELAVALALATPGPELLQRVTWSAGRAPGTVEARTTDRPFEALRLVNDADSARTFAVAVLDKPGVTQSQWVIRGQVRYESVAGRGYLEMWNIMDTGARYFTRTLGASGPMQWLSGTSVWREFALPFDASAGQDRPARLVVNVVLPGRGTVELSPLELYEGSLVPPAAAGAPGSAERAWWGNQASGWIGGLAGSAIGILGALIGLLMARGRAPGLVRSILVLETVLGLATVAIGWIALRQHQPYAVWYPLVLFGGFLSLWAPFFLRLSARRYREIELRKMAAFDAVR